MFTNRVASLLLIALVITGQTTNAQETKPGKFRVELNSGERFVLTSGRLTSDSLVGTTFSGKAKSVPIRSIYSLDRSKGTHIQAGAGIGTLLGVTCALVSFLHSASKDSYQPQKENSSDNIPLKLLGFVSAGGLLGIGIGSTIDKWEPVPLSAIHGSVPETGAIRFKLSLAF